MLCSSTFLGYRLTTLWEGWPPPLPSAQPSSARLSSRPPGQRFCLSLYPGPPPQPRGHPSKWGREGPQPWGLSVLDPVWGSRQVVSPFSASGPPDSKSGLLLWCSEASPLSWGRSSPGREQLQGLPVPGGGVHAPPSRPCLSLLSHYPRNPAGRGAPEGQSPPLRQGRRWISCPRRGCLLAQGRGHGCAVFNSPRLGSVPRGPPGCVAIVTAWEPQHPGQTGMRLPAHGSLAWGLWGVRQGRGAGWHMYASTHSPVSTWGLGKSHPVGELCTPWVLRTLPGVSPPPRAVLGKGCSFFSVSVVRRA